MFAISAQSKTPCFSICLGDLRVTLTIEDLRAEFDIPIDSPDDKLIALVERGLRFVSCIHPGDNVPAELLDGTASWKVKEHHTDLARARFIVTLAAWLTGRKNGPLVSADLAKLSEDPGIKEQAQLAFAELAERLGLGRQNSQQVVDRIENICREYAYIEALRERLQELVRIEEKLKFVHTSRNDDRTLHEELLRIKALMHKAIGSYQDIFETIDEQTGDIYAVLCDLPSTTERVRTCRNEAHWKLRLWDDQIRLWTGVNPATYPDTGKLLRPLYQLLATNFSTAQTWRTTGR